MEEEWDRDHEWKDWTGASFRGKGEWNYVWSQPAKQRLLSNGVVFDQGHEGMVLADFQQLFIDRMAAVGGGGELIPTLEEVAAARLYTGPAYVKINAFMRLVGRVQTRHWRARFAQLEGFTYSSTVYHLINAIRKIAQIDALERQRAAVQGEGIVLYRGVRGVLPPSFFEPEGRAGFHLGRRFRFYIDERRCGSPGQVHGAQPAQRALGAALQRRYR